MDNLRECSRSENARNAQVKKGSVTGYKGVSFNKKGQNYVARIRKNKKAYYSYAHSTPESAAFAYDDMARKHFGEFAYLNFPDPSLEEC